MSIPTIRAFGSQQVHWWTFHPLVTPLLSYHQLVLAAINKPFLSKNSCVDLLGRMGLIASTPLGYPVLAVCALVGIIIQKLTGWDCGKQKRRFALYDASRAGNEALVQAILNLNRHSKDDLIEIIHQAGNQGHRTMVGSILQKIHVRELDPYQRHLLSFIANVIQSNGYEDISSLIKEKWATV